MMFFNKNPIIQAIIEKPNLMRRTTIITKRIIFKITIS